MKRVSPAYKASMADELRERSFAIVRFENIGTEAASDGKWVSNGETSFSNLDTLDYKFSYGTTEATLEWNRWMLDGSQQIISVSTREGFVSNKVSSQDGGYNPLPTLTRKFTNIHMFPGLTITFDSRSDEWPVSVLVTMLLNGNNVYSSIEEVTDVLLAIETNVDEADEIRLVFYTSLPYRRVRVENILFGIWREYTNDELVEVTQSHDIDPLSRRLPSENFSFTVLDYDHLYDPDNPNGIYRFVEVKSPVYVRYGYELPSGAIEWLKEDNYLLDAQPEVQNNRATFTATGLVGSLSGIFYKSQLGEKNFYDMAVEVLEDASLPYTVTGGNPWVIDESLKTMYTTAVLPIDTHMNCLQMIAHACRCVLYTDDDNVIHIEPFGVTVSGIFDGVFSDNGHEKYSEWESVEKERISAETYATLEWNRWELGAGSRQIILPDSAYRQTGYVSKVVSASNGKYYEDALDVYFEIDDNGKLIAFGADSNDFYINSSGHLIYTGSRNIRIGSDGHIYQDSVSIDEPYFTRTFKRKTDLPIVGIVFDSVLQEHPTEIKCEYYSNNILIDEKTVEVDNYDFQIKSDYAYDIDRIKVTFKKVLPNYRARVMRVYFRETDFTLNFDNMDYGSQRISKIDKLKNVTVSKSIYTPNTNATKIYEATTDEEILHIEFSSIVYDLTVTLSTGSVKSVVPYGRAVDLTVSPGLKTITINGYIISESSAIKTYYISPDGETDEENNPLITSDIMQDALAAHVSQYLQMRNTYDVDYRGNPELETRDVIGYQTAFTDLLYGLILTDEIRFGGSLSGSLKVKGLIFTSNEQFTITAVPNIEEGGTTYGSGTYKPSDTVTLTETPASGYRFMYWMENGVILSYSDTLTFFAYSNRRIVAVFREIEECVITLIAEPEEAGTVTGGGTYPSGTDITVTATPGTEYKFVGWSENGVIVSQSEEYGFMVEGDRTLTALFEFVTFVLNVTARTGGTASGSGTYVKGTSVTVSATPDAGFYFTGWYENNEKVSDDANYTFSITTDRSLVATFSDTVYTITLIAEGDGTVIGGGIYAKDSRATVVATPGSGYEFSKWTEGGTDITTNAEYSFYVTADRTLTAVFLKLCTVTATIEPEGSGNVTGEGTYRHGEQVTLVATSNDGYRFVAWKIDETVVGEEAVYAFTINEDVEIVAEFEVFNDEVEKEDVQLQLSQARYHIASANVGNYALFVGGTLTGFSLSSAVDAFDANLQRTLPEYGLPRGMTLLSGASTENYALFAGENEDSNIVYYYNSSLSGGFAPRGLSENKKYITSVSSNQRAWFIGGLVSEYGSKSVDVYNNRLGRDSAENLGKELWGAAAVAIGNYVVVAGGRTTYYRDQLNIVEVYNSNTLTKETPPQAPLSVARSELTAVKAGSYIIFAGGQGEGNSPYAVDCYDSTLNKVTSDVLLSVDQYIPVSTEIDGHAMISSGNMGIIDVFNSNLVKQTPKHLSGTRRDGLAAQSIGEHALFAGGKSSFEGLLDTVESFKVT